MSLRRSAGSVKCEATLSVHQPACACWHPFVPAIQPTHPAIPFKTTSSSYSRKVSSKKGGCSGVSHTASAAETLFSAAEAHQRS